MAATFEYEVRYMVSTDNRSYDDGSSFDGFVNEDGGEV
jgi:hypothetical protein